MKSASRDEILEQSKAAIRQWGSQWRTHAQLHASDPAMKNTMDDFENSGVGRAVVAIGNGYSLEEQIFTLKAARAGGKSFDIICCDKTLGKLIDHGIMPNFCMVADANVDYEKYMKPWEDRLATTTLFMNVSANPLWSQNGNWKRKIYYVNKDILKSEVEFQKLSGCRNVILAATNVSNAIIVLLSQCGDNMPRNFFGYDKIILLGYDYCWWWNGKYYAFDQSADHKDEYMKHLYISTPAGNMGYTSGNLYFSFKWIRDYIQGFRLPVVQVSPNSLLQFGRTRDLAEQLDYEHKPHHAQKVRAAVKRLRGLMEEKQNIEKLLANLGREHQDAFIASV